MPCIYQLVPCSLVQTVNRMWPSSWLLFVHCGFDGAPQSVLDSTGSKTCVSNHILTFNLLQCMSKPPLNAEETRSVSTASNEKCIVNSVKHMCRKVHLTRPQRF